MNFEEFLQQKGIIPKTISRCQREVKKYEKGLELHDKLPEIATKKDLLEYLKYIKENRNLANVTQGAILRILRKYHAYLTEKHGIKNITHFIEIRGTRRKFLPALFTPEELDLLCDAYYYFTQEYTPNKRELYYHPNFEKHLQGRYIALTLIANQALTVLEIENLTQNDFDLRKATVNIHTNLRNAARKLPLEASQIGFLLQFYADGEGSPLIPNRNDFESLSQSLKKIQPAFRDFRHIRSSRITHWLKMYGLRKTQYLAGHRYVSSTENYLANEIETLQNDMANFHPLN
jgi:site-specific recombinase XerD